MSRNAVPLTTQCASARAACCSQAWCFSGKRRCHGALVVGGTGVQALGQETLLQFPQRGVAHQLRRRHRRRPPCSGQGGHGARIAVDAHVQVRVDAPARRPQRCRQTGTENSSGRARGRPPVRPRRRPRCLWQSSPARRSWPAPGRTGQYGSTGLAPRRTGPASCASRPVERRGHAHAHQARRQRAQAVVHGAHARLPPRAAGCRRRESRRPGSARTRTLPVKSTSSQSALRRPILMPRANAPSGFSARAPRAGQCGHARAPA